MAEIVNLHRARKTKAHADGKATAAENRLRFGRTKADKRIEAARAEKSIADHAGHYRGNNFRADKSRDNNSNDQS